MTATGHIANRTAITQVEILFLMPVSKSATNSVAMLFAKSLFILSALFGAQVALAQSEAVVAPAMPADPNAVDPENTLHLDLSTGGRVTIRLYNTVAPAHVERIKTLARRGFYDGVIFHRVIDGFMAQTGDPTGTGTGESDLPNLKPEFNPFPHLRGVVSMARATAEDSANSQFFICFQPRFSLDNSYTVFGRVTAGMQYVDAIQRGEPPLNPDRIIQASIGSDNKPAPVFAPVTPAEQPQITVDQLGK
jgi:cyclophilin family peptidyl-prolyl cis-trans isomerase